MKHEPQEDGDLVVTTSDGRDLGFRIWGDPEGSPIFWLHGTPGSRMLRDPTDAYARHGLAVCSYDRPGYGLSTRRPGRTQAQTIDDVVAIADALGWDRFAVAGASGGSGPALAVAARLPHRVARCAVVVGVAPTALEEVRAAMGEDDRAMWEREARGDEAALAEDFEGFTTWLDAGMPDLEVENEASRRMLEELGREARRQGALGYIDDCIADARDWGFVVEDVRVSTKIMAAKEDSDFLRFCSRWLAAHIPGAELMWRAGGHMNPKDNEEERLFAWLGHGVFPGPADEIPHPTE
jgi:pimeloyl-ACP methyl ester carboxylesterase